MNCICLKANGDFFRPSYSTENCDRDMKMLNKMSGAFALLGATIESNNGTTADGFFLPNSIRDWMKVAKYKKKKWKLFLTKNHAF